MSGVRNHVIHGPHTSGGNLKIYMQDISKTKLSTAKEMGLCKCVWEGGGMGAISMDPLPHMGSKYTQT